MTRIMPERRITVVTPVLNDWESLERLLLALSELSGSIGLVSVVVIDDGSTELPDPARLAAAAGGLAGVELISLACNLGHQRAIAIGLAHLVGRAGIEIVIVMDCDGEDRPEDIPRLIARHDEKPGAVVVATRAERSEGPAFRTLYGVYKAAFRACTGISIDFGNFCLVPGVLLDRLIARPEIWNHLAATIIRSRAPIERVPSARGIRYTGQSRMNLVSLVAHGLSGISVFVTEAFVRLIVVAFAMILLFLVVIVGAAGVRLFTDLAIPGWATTVVGLSFVILLQLVTVALALTFVMMSNRLVAPVMPAVHGRHYVRTVEVLT